MYCLADFCRLCLSSKGEFSDMWLDDIMEKVTSCISDLDFDSNLPLLICNTCLEKMEEYFLFRNQCLQSEFIINGYLDQLRSVNQTNFINTSLRVHLVQGFVAHSRNEVLTSLGTAIKTENLSSTLPISKENITSTGEVIDLDEDDVFVEEEDDNSVHAAEFLDKLQCLETHQMFKKQHEPKNVSIPDIYDPESLLIDSGKRRILWDAATDVSERVKLRKRNVQPHIDDQIESTKKARIAKKSTNFHQKAQHKKRDSKISNINKNDTTPNYDKTLQSKNRQTKKSLKSTTEKKAKSKNTSATRNLWKAACRNWTLQRMQISTGIRSSSQSARSSDVKKLENNDGHTNVQQTKILSSNTLNQEIPVNSNSLQLPIITTVECKELLDHNSYISSAENEETNNVCPTIQDKVTNVTDNQSLKIPRIKTINELNNLLKEKNNDFYEQLSSEYGIIIDDTNSLDSFTTSNIPLGLDSLEETNAEVIKTPQILNAFSLSNEGVLKTVEETSNEHDDELKRNFYSAIEASDDCRSESSFQNAETYLSSYKVDRNPEYSELKLDTFDCERAAHAEFIGHGSPHNTDQTRKSKITLKPINLLKAPRRRTKFKIKTTNNIILIDGNKLSPITSREEEKLYKANFGSILEHCLKTSESQKNEKSSVRLNPIKIVVPSQHSITGEEETITLNYQDLLSSNLLKDFPNKIFNIRQNSRCNNSTTNPRVSSPFLKKEESLDFLDVEHLETFHESNTLNTRAPKLNIPVVSATDPTFSLSGKSTDVKIHKEFEVVLIEDSPPSSSTSRSNRRGDDAGNTTTPKFENSYTSTTLKQSLKQHSKSYRSYCSAKSIRTSCEKSDNLIIDDSINVTSTPAEFNQSSPCESGENGTTLNNFESGNLVELANEVYREPINSSNSEHSSKENVANRVAAIGEDNDRSKNVWGNNRSMILKMENPVIDIPEKSTNTSKDPIILNFELFGDVFNTKPEARISKDTKKNNVFDCCTSNIPNIDEHGPILISNTQTNSIPEKFGQLTKCEQQTSLGRNATRSSNVFEAGLKDFSDYFISIGSDSENSVIDVENLSESDETDIRLFSKGSLDFKAKRRLLEKHCRKVRSENTSALLGLIEKDFIIGDTVSAILTSARRYIYSLKAKFEELDKEYLFLKTKHLYLQDTVVKLRNS